METKSEDRPARKPWESMKMSKMGNISSLVKSGGGKVSRLHPDGPDIRKPPGR